MSLIDLVCVPTVGEQIPAPSELECPSQGKKKTKNWKPMHALGRESGKVSCVSGTMRRHKKTRVLSSPSSAGVCVAEASLRRHGVKMQGCFCPEGMKIKREREKKREREAVALGGRGRHGVKGVGVGLEGVVDKGHPRGTLVFKHICHRTGPTAGSTCSRWHRRMKRRKRASGGLGL